MNFNELKLRIENFLAMAHGIVSTTTDNTAKTNLENAISALGKIRDFIDDDNTQLILTKHQNKDTASYVPLDVFCETICEKLAAISNSFDSSILNASAFQTTQGKWINTTQYQKFVNAINQVNSSLIVGFEILKHLDEKNRNLIILGANGSGKTSLANFLKKIDNNVRVIPAFKPLFYDDGHARINTGTTTDNFNQQLNSHI